MTLNMTSKLAVNQAYFRKMLLLLSSFFS